MGPIKQCSDTAKQRHLDSGWHCTCTTWWQIVVLVPLLSFSLSSQEACWESDLPQRMLGNDAVSCSAASS